MLNGKSQKPRSQYPKQRITKRDWLWVLNVSRLEAVTVFANQHGRNFVPCDWMVIPTNLLYVTDPSVPLVFLFLSLAALGCGSGSCQLTFLFLSSSEMQVSEESLSQVNSALKQVTIELETARGKVLALNDTKDLLTKEINDLQQTLTGKLVLLK